MTDIGPSDADHDRDADIIDRKVAGVVSPNLDSKPVSVPPPGGSVYSYQEATLAACARRRPQPPADDPSELGRAGATK